MIGHLPASVSSPPIQTHLPIPLWVTTFKHHSRAHTLLESWTGAWLGSCLHFYNHNRMHSLFATRAMEEYAFYYYHVDLLVWYQTNIQVYRLYNPIAFRLHRTLSVSSVPDENRSGRACWHTLHLAQYNGWLLPNTALVVSLHYNALMQIPCPLCAQNLARPLWHWSNFLIPATQIVII